MKNVLQIGLTTLAQWTLMAGVRGGQVGYALDFHPTGPGSTPSWGNLPKQKIIN